MQYVIIMNNITCSNSVVIPSYYTGSSNFIGMGFRFGDKCFHFFGNFFRFFTSQIICSNMNYNSLMVVILIPIFLNFLMDLFDSCSTVRVSNSFLFFGSLKLFAVNILHHRVTYDQINVHSGWFVGFRVGLFLGQFWLFRISSTGSRILKFCLLVCTIVRYLCFYTTVYTPCSFVRK